MPAQAIRSATPEATIAMGALLSRAAEQLERTAAAIARIELSLCVLVGQAGNISPKLVQDLQEIDLAQQQIYDISRVIQVAADFGGTVPVIIDDVDRAIKMRDLQRALLQQEDDVTFEQLLSHGGVSWL